jgi:hypothetical protein
MKYYLLDDLERRGTIVRTEGRVQHRYYTDRGWVRTGIMVEYFNDESPYYGSYSEITEEAANKLIAAM